MVMVDVRRRRIIHIVGFAVEDDARRPEVLCGAGPTGFLGKRIAEQLPMNEVARSGELDVDPLTLAQRLRRIGVIETVVGADYGWVGKVLIDYRVHISHRHGVASDGRGVGRRAGKVYVVGIEGSSH